MERRYWIFRIKLFAVGGGSYDPIFRSKIRIKLLMARAIFKLFQPDVRNFFVWFSIFYFETLRGTSLTR